MVWTWWYLIKIENRCRFKSFANVRHRCVVLLKLVAFAVVCCVLRSVVILALLFLVSKKVTKKTLQIKMISACGSDFNLRFGIRFAHLLIRFASLQGTSLINYSLFTIHYSLFTIHYSLFTTHYSLFTNNYFFVPSGELFANAFETFGNGNILIHIEKLHIIRYS